MPYTEQNVGWKKQDTSHEAAQHMEPRAPRLRRLTLEALRAHPAGLTADEIADVVGEAPANIRPRCSELYGDGVIQRTNIRRTNRNNRTQIVWKAK